MMQNNSLGTVAVSNSKRPRARFNLSSDLHTSMDFGSVVPARVQMMVPDSKVIASSREKIWCSPLLAPTMGRLGLKAYHNFVRLSDLTENFAPMMAQESVGRGTLTFVPQRVPHISVKALSFFVLTGAYLNVYKLGASSGDGPGDTASAVTAACNVYSGSSGILSSDADLSALGLLNKRSSYTPAGISTSCFHFDVGLFFFGNVSSTYPHRLPLGNPENGTFYSVDPSCAYYEQTKDRYDLSDVTPENADYVIPYDVKDSSGTVTATYYFCFRLSDFGKRLRKIFIGCGYQIDFTNESDVSLLPLFAFFKSYFDVFGLTLYTNWEQSFAYRCLRLCDLASDPDMTAIWSMQAVWENNNTDYRSMLARFIFNELGTTFYTDEQDFVSAHSTSTAVSPSASGFISSIDTDVDYSGANQPRVSDGSVQNPQVTLPGNPNGHAWINNIIHGQLDSELLKRLYRWTNRNTIAGRRIADLLRAQGFGAYVDECKSDFIGSFEVPISVYDGISQSDTYSKVSDSGAPLGERFGTADADSGKYADAEKPFTFECNEFGYWVTLFTVVPKGGYAEAIDPTILATGKWQFYNPEFDSLGMEFDPKSLVQGSMPFADFNPAAGNLADSFGLAPRYFRWKFGRNVANGDFTRRSRRSSFGPYYLDRIIDVGSRRIRDVTTGTQYKTYSIAKDFTPSQLPIAGNVWRYPTRYPFISRFNRIFNMQFADREHFSMSSVAAFAEFEFYSSSEDNFIIHTVFDVQYFAPMLPVEDSFETYDDDNGVNGSMSKA